MEINRTHLEALSTAELIAIADSYGIDIPHDLERIFIIEEILECSGEEKKEKDSDLEINNSYTETAALPKQYNISYIDIIIRDPLWIYALWEVKEHDKEIYEKNPNFNGYNLRIISLNDDNTAAETRVNSFIIPVDINDNARYIGFAEHSNLKSGRFIIKLGAICGEEEHQIALSQPFHLPRLISNDDIINMKENPLARLSGIAELSVIIDRQKLSFSRGR